MEKTFKTLIVISILIILSIGIWVTFIADCNKLKWVPVANNPMRCLDIKTNN